MTKTLFTLLILMTAYESPAQALKGWFQTIEKERGFQSDLFHFDGNRFYYRSSGCTGSTSGQGTFVVKAHHLQLYFEKTPADTSRIAHSLPCRADAMPTYCFLVVDRTSRVPLPGVSIISRKTKNGAVTTAAGTATFSYSSAPPADDLVTVWSVGYTPIDIPLPSAASRGFVVKLGPPYYFNEGDTLTFEIKKLRRNSFAMRPVFDSDDLDESKAAYTHCHLLGAEEKRKIMEWLAALH
ncbi:hypothetical protein Q5H92_18125 [Hymenobacter sp. M29]|uniref:Carboxypeptidase regulatory-like domain-containing protein n=1 Tax=Hymenobacter mellowenesis TaxID=3063995 RepID=A0ABT9AEM5_9BACT|nr:hypothetical protein [Hymenobacter sp. M29]MDO7848290.1 hypothetical protein [Hymenobacter sp. M29]